MLKSTQCLKWLGLRSCRLQRPGGLHIAVACWSSLRSKMRTENPMDIHTHTRGEVCIYIYIYICVCVFIYRFIFPIPYVFIYEFPFVFLICIYTISTSIHPSIRPSVHPSIRPSIHTSIHPCIHAYIVLASKNRARNCVHFVKVVWAAVGWGGVGPKPFNWAYTILHIYLMLR